MADVTNNPYTPDNKIGDSGLDTSERRMVVVDFVPILDRWERLRIVYNATLVCIVMATTFFLYPFLAISVPFWVRIIFGGVIANLCFTIAPAIEGYGTRFQIWHPLFTILLFLVGLAFASLLAMFCISEYANV